MSTTAQEHMLKAGLENPVKDPRTGVFRERVEGYSPRPGGVRIPSAEDGDGGGQLGVSDPAAPMPYTVVIGIPGQGGFEVRIDPSLITAEEHADVFKRFSSADDRYKELAKITERKSRKMTAHPSNNLVAPAGAPSWARSPGNSQSIRGAAPAPRAPAPVPAPVPAAPRVQAPVVPPPPLVPPITPPMGAPAGGLPDNVPPPQVVPQVESAVDIIDQQIASLQRQKEQVIRDQQEEAARATEGAGDPQIAVNFVYPDGTAESGFYHHAALEMNDGLLVLQFDNRSAGGQVFVPRTLDAKTPIGIGVGAPDGTQVSVHALSLGMVFPVADYTVLVFPVQARLS